ncbi:MAG: fluoride efflux transporter CrcB [Bacteroidota bacterium]
MNWLLVFIGGGIGSLLRYGVGRLIASNYSESSFPLATLISNVASCVIFALVFTFILSRSQQPGLLQLLLITGICGGFSTFSAFSFETFQLLQRQEYGFALANVLINVFSCLLIFVLLARK